MQSVKERITHTLTAILILASCVAYSQAPNALEQQAVMRQSAEIMKTAPQDLKDLTKSADAAVRYNAVKVGGDIQKLPQARKSAGSAKVLFYAIQALDNIPLDGDLYPEKGAFLAPVDIVMAQEEYEPGSFLLYATQDFKDVQLSVGDLRTKEGAVIKKDDVDLKVIKVWYQNGNSWFNYFGDDSRKLIPELLLNDESLVMVDRKKQENYLRVDYETDSKYIWISAPEQIDPEFKLHQEPVYDAPALKPVQLTAGKFKQFYVTVHTTKDTAPGLYTGNIQVGNLANIPIRVRVMPFVLPEPKTYYDLNADFYTMLYCVPGSTQYYTLNGKDQALSDKKAMARLLNQKKHNVTSPLYMGAWNGYDNVWHINNSIAMAKKAGMKMNPFFEAFGCYPAYNRADYLALVWKAKTAKDILSRQVGHTNLWPAGGEEPGYNFVVNARSAWKVSHDLGMHVMCNGGDRRHFSGYNDEFRIGGGFANANEAEFMHRIKGKIGNYAGPHTGPENPDYMRRMHGINLYKKNYDMMYNYGYTEGGWNDFHTGSYRNFALVYYTRDSMIDTIEWEGIREGIDDIRYATLMLTLADKTLKLNTTEATYAAKKALQFMALLNEETADLPEMRLEIIRHIMNLKGILETKGGKK